MTQIHALSELTKDTPWEEVPENVRSMITDSRSKIEIHQGAMIPSHFCNTLADAALDLVYHWLKNNHAPQDIIDLLGNGLVLKDDVIYRLTDGKEPRGLLEYTLETLKAIYAAGGQINHSPDI